MKRVQYSFSKLILKPLTDDTSFFINYLQFILYQPLIDYQLVPFYCVGALILFTTAP